MWMLMGVMGMLVASSVSDAMMRFGNGRNGAADDDDTDAPALAVETGAGDDHHVPGDRWLDEWADDEFISSDDSPADETPPDADTLPSEPAPPSDPDERWPDPWLDGWTDDSFVSTDTLPEGDTGADDDEDSDEHESTGRDDDPPATTAPEEPEERWPDPWLDGWTDDSHVSSDIPDELLALGGGAAAIHVLNAGETLTTDGAGGAFVIGDWISDGQPPVVTGFDPAVDRLIFAYDDIVGAPDITIATDPENALSTVLVDTVPVLVLSGNATLSAEAVLLHPIRFDG